MVRGWIRRSKYHLEHRDPVWTKQKQETENQITFVFHVWLQTPAAQLLSVDKSTADGVVKAQKQQGSFGLSFGVVLRGQDK